MIPNTYLHPLQKQVWSIVLNSMSSKSQASAAGQALWAKMPKANAELFALTYGSLVTELGMYLMIMYLICAPTLLLCY